MKPKIAFVSLGCDKNLVDSEVMLGLINEAGYDIVQDENEADAIVVNTCAFIHDAKQESIENIIELGEYKKNGKCRALVVTGCLAQRYQKEIFKELPEVDAVVGTASYPKIVEVIDRTLKGEKVEQMDDINSKEIEDRPRIVTTAGHYEFLKIAEGCYNHCTYCIIPKLRGNFRSRSMESLIKEAKDLVTKGTKELILIAQDVTSYGIDLNDRLMLPELLKELCKIDDLKWIRLMYCYPERITDELIQVMKEEKKICKYIDMPIQHINNDILKKMGRKSRKEDIKILIDKLRHQIPDVTIRTTVIVGFPGESKEHFEELKEFVKEIKFDRLGAFTYSDEEDTPAALLPEKVGESTKQKRKDDIMELQNRIVDEKANEYVGQELEVIVEGKIDKDDVYMARTYKDAPDVDGLLFFDSTEEIITGEFRKVKVIEARGYDLVGKLES